MENIKIDKTKLKASGGQLLTQSLFLEFQYDTKSAVFTTDDEHKEFKGKFYPSLKKLYLEHMDPVGYDFARTYLFNWTQWQRMKKNSFLKKHIQEWEEELNLKIMSEAVRNIQDIANSADGGFGAAKWLADRGWDKRRAGRPSKEQIEAELNKQARDNDEFAADIKRLEDYK